MISTLSFKIKYRLASISKYAFLKFVILFKSYNLTDSLLIFGEPRSGSTWLMELISGLHHCVCIWEPLHFKHGLKYSHFDEKRIFEHPEMINNNLEDFLSKIFILKKANYWTLNFAGIQRILFSKQTLTKFVRGNLLLPWIVKNFKLKFKPILIIRHPIAIAQSQIFGKIKISEELISADKVKRIYPNKSEKYLQLLDQAKSPLEQFVTLWCINHKYILDFNELNPNSIIIICYEDLLSNPEKHLKRIWGIWEIPWKSKRVDYRRASKSDFQKQLMEQPDQQLEKWKEKVDSNDQDKIQHILNEFEINIYTAFEVFPTTIP